MPRCSHAKSHLIAAKVSRLRRCDECDAFFVREKMEPQTDQEIYDCIVAAAAELVALGVKPERFSKVKKTAELVEILESLREQVARRKKFLGEKL